MKPTVPRQGHLILWGETKVGKSTLLVTGLNAKELGVPIGLINSSWGGSPIEPWTVDEKQSGGMHNGMIAPLQPFPIRGVIWYQGESNVGNGMKYRDKMEALITGWRQTWGPEMPFYFVQIAPFSGYGGENLAPFPGHGLAFVIDARELLGTLGLIGISGIIEHIEWEHAVTAGARWAAPRCVSALDTQLNSTVLAWRCQRDDGCSHAPIGPSGGRPPRFFPAHRRRLRGRLRDHEPHQKVGR